MRRLLPIALTLGCLAGTVHAVPWRSEVPPTRYKVQEDWWVPQKPSTDYPRRKCSIDPPKRARYRFDPFTQHDEDALSAAIIWQRAVVADPPDEPGMRFALAQTLFDRAAVRTIRGFDAEERCLYAVRRIPNDLRTEHRVATDSCIETRRAAERLPQVDRDAGSQQHAWIAKHHPDFEQLDDVLFSLGLRALRQKRMSAATKYFGRLLSASPGTPHRADALHYLAEAKAELGKPARAHFIEARALQTDVQRSFYLWARQAWSARRTAPTAALRDVLEMLAALKTVPAVKSRHRWVQCGGITKRFRRALESDARVIAVLAFAEYDNANPSRAIEFFERHFPNQWSRAVDDLASQYLKRGRHGAAIELSKAIERRIPRTASRQLRRIAYATWMMGKHEQVVELVESFAARLGVSRWIAHIAFQLHRDGDLRLADRVYAAYLKDFRNRRFAYEVQYFAAHSLARQGRWTEAAERFEALVETERPLIYRWSKRRFGTDRTEAAARAAIFARRKAITPRL